jgi:uncharacterized protein
MMTDPIQRFKSVCEAMTDPEFYPHAVSDIKRHDTHISVVFLTGEWAYKLKKPLNLGFLDFREIDDRRKFCELEILLNRRLSHGIYQNTVKIVENKHKGFSMEKDGKPAEYAVKMRQLPDKARLANMLIDNNITRSDLERLGEKLAFFYKKSDRSSQIDQYGQRDMIIYNSEENFSQIAPYVGVLLDTERWKFICEVNRSFLYHHHALFERRIEKGKILDGHGDLRTDHIYFIDGIQIIDCIEFNDRFRYGDAAVDLAFLHMDMEQLGYPQQSQVVLKAYVDCAEDPEIYALIDFYAVYRAIVRLKVACIRYDELETLEKKKTVKNEINSLLNQAYRYTLLFSRPTLWVFNGLPASGKSSLAQRLANALSMAVYSSDSIRKEKDSRQELVPYGEGTYTEKRRRRIYTKMLAMAQEKLKKGRSVILDATYAQRVWREEVVRLASDMDSNLIFVECVCKPETIQSRLKEREKFPGLSDARIQHLPQIINHFEPITEVDPHTHVKVKTEGLIDETFHRVLSEAYLCKSAQIKSRI